MAALATPLTFRRALLTDRAAMVSLLTTAVGGTSPYQEIVADWGAKAVNWTLAQLLAAIQAGWMQVVVCFDKNGIMRGWNLFQHYDGVDSFNIGATGVDVWQDLYGITDKSLVLADRLTVVKAMIKAAAGQIAGTTYIFGDVRTPGNLDTALATILPHVNVTIGGLACHRYYATAATILGKL
jgi:hypothetical protein